MKRAAPKGAKKHRAGDAPQLSGRKIELIATVPKDFCKTTHPCPYRPAGRALQLVAIWELQFDATHWLSNPQGLVNLTGANPTTTLKILRLLWLVGFLVHRIMMPKEESAIDPITGKSVKVFVPTTSTLRITWERVPHKDNPSHFVAYRLRIIEYGDPLGHYSMTHELSQLIWRNHILAGKHLTEGGGPPRFPKGPESHVHISQSVWNGLALFCRPDICIQMANCPADQCNNLLSPASPFRPTNVFSIHHNMQTAALLGAHPAYCDAAAALRRDQWGNIGEVFAEDGKNVWEVSVDSLDPDNLHRMWMPHNGPSARTFLVEMAQFGRMHNIQDPVQLRTIFNLTCNTSSEVQEANDMNALTKRIKQEVSELRTKHRCSVQKPKAHEDDEDDVRDEFYAEHLAYRKKMLLVFGEIISSTGDCPPAMQAIASELSHYLHNNNNCMSVPMESSFSNLTRFQDQRALEAITMDQIMTVATSHQDCLLYLYSALHVYARVAMNAHHLLLGPAGIGKSFALIIITQLLIAETWRSYTYVTAKAMATPGKGNACLIMIFEDAPSSTFGASNGSGGAGKKNATSDQENLMKQFMTSTDMSLQTITMEPKRAGEFIRCETSCVVFAAMNDPSSMFPFPVLDRFCVTVSAEEVPDANDPAAGNLMGKTQRQRDPAVKLASAELKGWWARRQILCAYILHMESCGLLATIDVSVSDAFFAMVATLAKARHVNMERSRPLDRYRMIVRMMVVLNAIDLLWDSPQSPIAGLPFSMDHFLLVDKYLVATVQMGVFAMGLVARQWQDSARSSIVKVMKKNWFPHADERVAAYEKLAPLSKDGSDPLLHQLPRAPVPPDGYHPFRGKAPASAAVSVYEEEAAIYDGMRNERKYWMYDSCKLGGALISAPPQNGNKGADLDATITHMARQLHPLLPGRFLHSEIEGKLRAMTTDMVQVRRNRVGVYDLDDNPNPDFFDVHTQDSAQLFIDGDVLRMALPTLKHADDGADVLYQCVQEVVTIIYAMGQPLPGMPARANSEAHASFLYGETEQRKGGRHVWRVVKADKAKARALDRDMACRVYNPAYAETSMQTATQTFLKAQDPEYYNERTMRRLFSAKRPFTIMDANMDEVCYYCCCCFFFICQGMTLHSRVCVCVCVCLARSVASRGPTRPVLL